MAVAAAVSQRLLSKLKPHSRCLLLFSTSAQHPNPNPNPNPQASSLQSQFKSWTSLLRPGYSPADLELALRSQPDPDLALDLFRWSQSSSRRRAPASTYRTILSILLDSRRFAAAEYLLHQVLAGACPPDLPLLNLLIDFSASRRHLFSSAFDLYALLTRSAKSDPSVRPDLATYKTLLTALLRRFGKPPVSHIHLHSLRSLVRQMKAFGVVPDLYTLNIVIKAYAKCLEMDEAVRVFRELGLYGCEPNEYSYGYLAKGMFEKGGRAEEGMRWFREMRGKGLVPTSGVYMTVVCGLAMEGRLDEGKEVMVEMVGNGMKGDLLTYRTLLERFCRDGRGEEAMEMLEELGRTKGAMDRRMYGELLDGLHWLAPGRR